MDLEEKTKTKLFKISDLFPFVGYCTGLIRIEGATDFTKETKMLYKTISTLYQVGAVLTFVYLRDCS